MAARVVLPKLRALRRSFLDGRVKHSRALRLQMLRSTAGVQQPSQRSRTDSRLRKWLPAALTAAIAVTATLTTSALCDASDSGNAHKTVGQPNASLPTFSWAQVQQHAGSVSTTGVWVVYKHGVYDVSKFAYSHPGGTKILQAAGKSVELFWQLSEAHKRPIVPETLEMLRIGNLQPQDVQMLEEAKQRASHDSKSSSWRTSPLLERFFFLESSEEPAELPSVDNADFRLMISTPSGFEKGFKVKFLSLKELQTQFKQHSVTTTIRCATPRASGDSSDGKTSQTRRVPATWTGVLLSDVLADLGVTSTATASTVREVRFEALDRDSKGNAFGASIAATTAMDAELGVLLAFEMDGQPIPREHGYPLRVIVPGTTGARNVKFVHRIIVQ